MLFGLISDAAFPKSKPPRPLFWSPLFTLLFKIGIPSTTNKAWLSPNNDLKPLRTTFVEPPKFVPLVMVSPATLPDRLLTKFPVGTVDTCSAVTCCEE